MNTNIFEQASRRKLKFSTAQGLINVEDLWDLPLTARGSGVSLDAIAVELDDKLQTGKKSFVVETKKENALLQLKFDIVKHVIDTKLAEKAAEEDKAEKAERKRQLAAVLVKRQTEHLEAMSEEDIRKELDALG